MEKLQLQCSHCQKLFTSDKGLKKHMLQVHRNDKILHYCNFCDKTFKYKYQVNLHQSNVHVKKVCEFCDKEIIAGNYNRHKMEKHLVILDKNLKEKFECEKCGELFTRCNLEPLKEKFLAN